MVKRKKRKPTISWDLAAWREARDAVLVALNDLTKAQGRLADAVLRLM